MQFWGIVDWTLGGLCGNLGWFHACRCLWVFVGGGGCTITELRFDDRLRLERLIGLEGRFLIYVRLILDVTTRAKVSRKIRRKMKSLSLRCLAFRVM